MSSKNHPTWGIECSGIEDNATCFEAGVYSVSGKVTDEQTERVIWTSYNPGVI